MAVLMDRSTTALKRVVDICIIAFLSFFLALYIEYFFEVINANNLKIAVYGISAGDYSSIAILMRVIVLFMIIFIALATLVAKGGPLFHFIDKYRYVIALIILIACVFLELSGSSIGIWTNIIPGSNSSGTIFGMSRAIRSDEWNVFTPFSISQSYTDYSPISNVLRAAPTDVTMTYAQPSWSLATLFRPFLWGYLLLGTAKGLSFFWVARILALLLVTYECTKLWTHNNKTLSAIVSVLFTFSPIVQWWFAVNGTAELFIFGQGVVLCVNALAKTSSIRVKALVTLLLAWCMGGYLMILYPAWQVSLLYVFAILAIYVLARQWRLQSSSRQIKRHRDVSFILMAFAICISLVAICVFNSWNAVQATLNTVYPGHRTSTGGGLFSHLLGYGFSIFGSLDADSFTPNVCEASAIFSLFPLGLFLGIYCAIIKRDKLLMALIAVEALFLLYGCIGFPELLSKLTLLSLVPTIRIEMALGALDVILLARSCSLLIPFRRYEKSSFNALIVPISLSAALVVSIACYAQSQTTSASQKLFLLMLFAALCAIFISLGRWLQEDTAKKSRLALVACISVITVSGLCVNPVQKGDACVSGNDTVKSIESIASQSPDAAWLADDNMLGQTCVMAGAPCINSTNTYPDISRWSALDPTGEYKDIYNRYAHIKVELSNQETSFVLTFPDSFTVKLNVDDIKKLGARYFLSRQDLDQFDTGDLSFNLLEDCGNGLSIYEIQ